MAAFAVRAVQLEDQHDFDELVTNRMHGLALAQLCFGREHPEVTGAVLRLARAYERRGLHAQSELHAQTVLERLQAINHPIGTAEQIQFAALTTLGQALLGWVMDVLRVGRASIA